MCVNSSQLSCREAYSRPIFGAFAFGNVGDYAHVLEIAGAISSGMRNRVDVLDDTVWHENSMLDIQVHAVLRGTIRELSHAFQVFGVNSVEYQIERRICFSCEAQNSDQTSSPLRTFHPESPRMTQPLSLCQILPSSLQLCLRTF